MDGRRLGKARRWAGMAVTAAGAVLVLVAVYGIAGSGNMRHQLASALMALPSGLLLLLAGSDLLCRSVRRSPLSRPVASLDQWLATAQGRRYAAKAATN